MPIKRIKNAMKKIKWEFKFARPSVRTSLKNLQYNQVPITNQCLSLYLVKVQISLLDLTITHLQELSSDLPMEGQEPIFELWITPPKNQDIMVWFQNLKLSSDFSFPLISLMGWWTHCGKVLREQCIHAQL